MTDYQNLVDNNDDEGFFLAVQDVACFDSFDEKADNIIYKIPSMTSYIKESKQWFSFYKETYMNEFYIKYIRGINNYNFVSCNYVRGNNLNVIFTIKFDNYIKHTNKWIKENPQYFRNIKSMFINKTVNNFDNKDKINYIIKNIKENNNIKSDVFHSLDKLNQLIILKYYFAKHCNTMNFLINIICDEFIFDLLSQTIITNQYIQAQYLLKNKKIYIDETEYKKLIDKSTELKLFQFNSLFMEYMMYDSLMNTDDDKPIKKIK